MYSKCYTGELTIYYWIPGRIASGLIIPTHYHEASQHGCDQALSI